MNNRTTAIGPTNLSLDIIKEAELTLRNADGSFATFPAGTFTTVILSTPLGMSGSTEWEGKKVHYECQIRPKWDDQFNSSQYENKLSPEFEKHIHDLAMRTAPQVCSKTTMSKYPMEKHSTSYKGREYEVSILFSFASAAG